MMYQIKPHDRMTFWVKSREGSGEYLVDLTELKGNGMCTCPHFRCRMEGKVREDKKTRRCKHIMAVRDHLADMLIKEMGQLNSDKGAA
tara:strand:- start:214 stop:477 length:264 start_codon:yes stop_codon:yes gene_type:complete